MARPHKPRELKQLAGTLRANRDNGIEKLEGLPQPPAFLSKGGLAAWHTLFPMLADTNVLSMTDTAALAGMCETYAQWLKALQALNALESWNYEATTDRGAAMVREYPQVKQFDMIDARFRKYLTEFGLTPAARNKVTEVAASKADNPFAQF